MITTGRDMDIHENVIFLPYNAECRIQMRNTAGVLNKLQIL